MVFGLQRIVYDLLKDIAVDSEIFAPGVAPGREALEGVTDQVVAQLPVLPYTAGYACLIVFHYFRVVETALAMPPEDGILGHHFGIFISCDEFGYIVEGRIIMVEAVLDDHFRRQFVVFSSAEYSETAAVEPAVSDGHFAGPGQDSGSSRSFEGESIDDEMGLPFDVYGEIGMFGKCDLFSVVAGGAGWCDAHQLPAGIGRSVFAAVVVQPDIELVLTGHIEEAMARAWTLFEQIEMLQAVKAGIRHQIGSGV